MNKLRTSFVALTFLLSGLILAIPGQTHAQPPRPDTVHAQAPHPDTTHAQTTAATSTDDGPDGTIFFLLAFLAIMCAAILLGALILAGFLVVLFALVSAGILSTSILIGMYRRSIMAGFRTLLVIGCSLAGLFTGAVGLYLVRGVFNLHWKTKPTLLTGAGGGLIGGLVLGLIIFYIIRKFLQFCRQRLAWKE